MTITDPISDMLTRIRNGGMAGQPIIAMPSSKVKASIAEILKSEGFIKSFEVVDGEKPSHKVLRVDLKYVGDRRTRRPVISGLERVSKPGRRIYAKKDEIPWVLSGIGITIVSTPKGVMTDRKARKIGVGGEVLCKVW